ncbi:hypothetical protein CBFG_02925 [Clostridiales bacterium 1_7_47FAA]|nr:hypothetical protein CBFG_02925 [Clostridiales bacterium 1_7_47FAA]
MSCPYIGGQKNPRHLCAWDVLLMAIHSSSIRASIIDTRSCAIAVRILLYMVFTSCQVLTAIISN